MFSISYVDYPDGTVLIVDQLSHTGMFWSKKRTARWLLAHNDDVVIYNEPSTVLKLTREYRGSLFCFNTSLGGDALVGFDLNNDELTTFSAAKLMLRDGTVLHRSGKLLRRYLCRDIFTIDGELYALIGLYHEILHTLYDNILLQCSPDKGIAVKEVWSV